MTAFLREHLDGPPTPDAMSRIRAATDGAVRVRRDASHQTPLATPRMDPNGPQPTVGDVDTTSADAYCRSVRSCAHAVAVAVARNP